MEPMWTSFRSVPPYSNINISVPFWSNTAESIAESVYVRGTAATVKFRTASNYRYHRLSVYRSRHATEAISLFDTIAFSRVLREQNSLCNNYRDYPLPIPSVIIIETIPSLFPL